MGGLRRALLVAILSVVIISIEGFRSRNKSPKEKAEERGNGIYDCLMNELCTCKVIGNYNSCWSELKNRTKNWMIDRVNNCNLSTPFETQDFNKMTQSMCDFNQEEWKPCYQKINAALSEYIKKINKEEGDAESAEESTAVEAARICLSPNIMKCSDFGFGCF